MSSGGPEFTGKSAEATSSISRSTSSTRAQRTKPGLEHGLHARSPARRAVSKFRLLTIVDIFTRLRSLPDFERPRKCTYSQDW